MEVVFFRLAEVTNDDRRVITEHVFASACLGIRQIKFVLFKTGNQKPVGQHSHKVRKWRASRKEIFVVIGKVLFGWRDESGAVQQKELNNGEGVVIPPGASHSFLSLAEGSMLLGLSNLPYNSKDDVSDKLF